jgi:hypothetical protein
MKGPLPDPSTVHLRRLAAGRARASREVVTAKSMSLEAMEDARPEAEALTGLVEASLDETLKRMAPDEIGDPREFRRALGILLAETKRVARKLDADPTALLSRSETSPPRR